MAPDLDIGDVPVTERMQELKFAEADAIANAPVANAEPQSVKNIYLILSFVIPILLSLMRVALHLSRKNVSQFRRERYDSIKYHLKIMLHLIEQPPKSRRPNKRVKVEPKDDVENSAQSERPMKNLTDAELDLLIVQGDADAVAELALRLETPELIDQPSVSSVPYIFLNIPHILKLRGNLNPSPHPSRS